MAETHDARISRLLDRLEKPGLTDRESAQIMRQVEFLESQRDWQA